MKRHLPEYSTRLIPAARMLRKRMTEAERKLWSVLRGNHLGVKFRRQVPFGPYILDFYCASVKLDIELDGSQHGTPRGLLSDMERDNYLKSLGNRVLRYPNSDVLRNIEGVVRDITEHLGQRSKPDDGDR